MKAPYLLCMAAAFQLLLWSTVRAQTVGAQDRSGLRCVSSKPFPVPQGSQGIPMDGCDFETGKLPPGWSQGYGEVVTADDAPQGKAYFRMQAKKGADLHSPAFPAESGGVYFISYWLKNSDEPWAYINFTSDEREPSFNNTYPGIPFNTGNQWKQVGFYFWMPAQCKTIQFLLAPHENSARGTIRLHR